MKVFLAVLFCVATSFPARCYAAKAETLFVYGAGNNSCREWTEGRAKTGSDLREFAWVQGFVTAAGITQQLKKTDKPGIIAYIDRFCQVFPDDDISTAAITLAPELGLQPPKGGKP